MQLGNNRPARAQQGRGTPEAPSRARKSVVGRREQVDQEQERERANLELLRNTLSKPAGDVLAMHYGAPERPSSEALLTEPQPLSETEVVHHIAPTRTSSEGLPGATVDCETLHQDAPQCTSSEPDPAAHVAHGPMHQDAPDSTNLRPALRRWKSPEEPAVARLEAELSPPQARAIGLLLLGKSMSSVARIVGVDRSTLFRWRQQKAFATVLRFRQEVLFHEAIDGLRISLVRAVHEIKQELASKYRHVRLSTAYRLLPYVGSPKLLPADRPRAPAESPPAVAVPESGG